MLVAGIARVMVIRVTTAKFAACNGKNYKGEFGCTKASSMGKCSFVEVRSDMRTADTLKPKRPILLPFETGTIQDKPTPWFFPKIDTEPHKLDRYISQGTKAEQRVAKWFKKAQAMAKGVTDPKHLMDCNPSSKREFLAFHG